MRAMKTNPRDTDQHDVGEEEGVEGEHQQHGYAVQPVEGRFLNPRTRDLPRRPAPAAAVTFSLKMQNVDFRCCVSTGWENDNAY